MRFRLMLSLLVVLTVTLVAFLPVLEHEFVNWDDPSTLQQNPHLNGPRVVAWAFTTTEMGHYQPLAWLAWSQAKAFFGLDPRAFHALSLLGHLLNVALVYVGCLRFAAMIGLTGPSVGAAAVIAAFAFGVHPIRVEAVAWASAFPYVLSLTFLLAAFLAYLAYRRPSSGNRRAGWFWLSVGAYALSQLTRATAVAFPLVLWLTDSLLERRTIGSRSRPFADKLPFLVVALLAAIAESQARELATFEEVGLGARLTMAASAPFVYLGRTLLPIRLSPLDPLPIDARVAWMPLALGLVGLTVATVFLWSVRRKWSGLAVAWGAYLLLLAPAVGLTPSGQQATADRYMYVPGVVIALLIGLVCTHVLPADRVDRRHALGRHGPRVIAVSLGIAAAVALGVATWRQVTWWRDSITLWTRAAELDPENDIASYNLAIALAEAGREDEAIVRYRQTLRLVPDHEFARQNLNLILAAKAEREGDRSSQAGNLETAIDRYAEALAADPSRLHARAARGMALLQRGRFAEAAVDLRLAFDAVSRQWAPEVDTTATLQVAPNSSIGKQPSKDDLAVANALAFALAQLGQHGDAVAVLKQSLARYPQDDELAHNLARLLATAPDPTVRDGQMALRLALAVRDRTSGRDPRVLDTLAAAYAADGQFDRAYETARVAAMLATQFGQREMADEIAAHARSYLRRR